MLFKLVEKFIAEEIGKYAQCKASIDFMMKTFSGTRK